MTVGVMVGMVSVMLCVTDDVMEEIGTMVGFGKLEKGLEALGVMLEMDRAILV